ncbi:MAG: response regulator transcription factor [Chloroflexota bacterium]|nr:response regulator transcription factor [Chloroflexota bacterium]
MTEQAPSTPPIRVLLADDHTLFRQGMRALLASVNDIELIGEAADGEEAVARAEELQPDVILMDLKMPGTNGITATRRILRADLRARVVVLTMLEDDDSLFAAMRAGARGYVVKGADESEMLRVVRAVANGEVLFGSIIAERLVGFFSESETITRSQAFPDLTDREREVLSLIARGMSNAAIANQLFLSPKTVRNHISSIFDKLQVTDRAQAIVRAREAGMGH